MSTSPPELLTEQDAAATLKVCPRTLRKERQAGRLPYILIGRSVRYAPSDLEVFVQRSRTIDVPRQKRSGGKASPNHRSGVIVPFSQRGRRA